MRSSLFHRVSSCSDYNRKLRCKQVKRLEKKFLYLISLVQMLANKLNLKLVNPDFLQKLAHSGFFTEFLTVLRDDVQDKISWQPWQWLQISIHHHPKQAVEDHLRLHCRRFSFHWHMPLNTSP